MYFQSKGLGYELKKELLNSFTIPIYFPKIKLCIINYNYNDLLKDGCLTGYNYMKEIILKQNGYQIEKVTESELMELIISSKNNDQLVLSHFYNKISSYNK